MTPSGGSGQNASMARADKQPPTRDDSSAESQAKAAKASDSTSAGKPASSEDDDLRRAYREALERKHGGGPHNAGGHTGPKPPAPTSNDKRQRTFRRKSG